MKAAYVFFVVGFVSCGVSLSRAAVDSPVREGPQILKPGDHGVGCYIPDATFTDVSGRKHRLSQFKNKAAVAVAMTSTSCPLSKKYLPTLLELAKSYSDRGIQFVLVNPVASDDMAEMKATAKSLGDSAIYVHDRGESFTNAVGALTTTDVIVFDSSRTVQYHGAIDDQYGFGYSLDAPRRTFLVDALNALLGGRQPLVTATAAPGCELDTRSDDTTATALKYHGRVSRLIQRHCVECHRDGGVAPFALDTYEDVIAHAGMIRRVVDRGIMPPWFAAESDKSHASPWVNDRSLSDSEKKDVIAWIKGGMQKGDVKDAARPKTFHDGWLIGKPDAVFGFSKPVAVKATGVMPYKNITIETKLPEDKWVQAIEVRPGEVGVVHHVLVFVRTERSESSERRRDATADERQGYWGIYVPGNSTLVYPDGYAKRLPKGAKLRFQMHYTPNGKATEDVTRIGLVFAKEKPKHEVRVAGIVNARLRIPPGADNHKEVATLPVPVDVQLLAFLPHMHLRGKAARYEVLNSKGTRTLLDIPRYDFNWQLLYRYANPPTIKAGSKLQFTAWYDNSANNPANPDPTRTVRWGPQTYDEMQLGYVEYIIPGLERDDGSGIHNRRGPVDQAVRKGVNHLLLKRLDANGDGLITREEVKQRMPQKRLRSALTVFDRLDRDKNGKLDSEEFANLHRQPN